MQGKVAVVTGGASGIGYAIAKQFVRSGANVVIADLDIAAGNKVANEFESFGAESLFVETNVARSEDVQSPDFARWSGAKDHDGTGRNKTASRTGRGRIACPVSLLRRGLRNHRRRTEY